MTDDVLSGKHILVVEDEYLIAADIERMLTRRNAIVLGPAGCLENGLSLTKNEAINAAILDMNLEHGLSFPIVDRLIERRISYLLMTGYNDWALPPDYRMAPRITKPFRGQTMLEMIERLCGEPCAA